MEKYLLGADYGTGGAKLALINTQGEVLGYSFEEYPIYTDKPGWSEHDAPLYWDVFCRLINNILIETKVNPKAIKGIAVSSALPSVVFIDKSGAPFHRAYNLMDRRATKEVAWLKENIGEPRIQSVTANRLEDHPALVNILWEKNNRPEDFKRIWKALTIDGFITYKLTEKATLNRSGALFFGVAYNILKQEFDKGILDEMGINPDILPDLYDCEEIIGVVSKRTANETGLAEGTPVAAGQIDCNAGYIAGGAIDVGDFQMNLGTCGNFGILFRNTDFMFTDQGAASLNFPYTIDSRNLFITVPTTTTGGQTIRYIRDNFSKLEIETERLIGIDSYDLLNIQARKIPLGSEGLIMLPYLMGERTPIWDVNARGVLFGLSLNHTKGHFVRAAMEGVAYALYHSFEVIISAGLKVNYPLVLNEGGAKSVLWRRIITDVFNVQTVLLGDAILAGVATGIFKDYSITKDWVEYIEPMQPNQENHERYMEYFELFKKIYKHLKLDFIELAEIRNK